MAAGITLPVLAASEGAIPGVTIPMLVLSTNRLGDWFRDTLAPGFRLTSGS